MAPQYRPGKSRRSVTGGKLLRYNWTDALVPTVPVAWTHFQFSALGSRGVTIPQLPTRSSSEREASINCSEEPAPAAAAGQGGSGE